MDLSALIESLQRGLGEIPSIAIALVLLAGPTAALIGYRLIGVARRMQTAPETEVAPFWVCQDCRSVNELRLSRCYRCGTERDTATEIEVIVDQPQMRPTTFEAPAGSPFAALGAASAAHGTGPAPSSGRGVPVMAEDRRGPVPVGPGSGATTGQRPAEPVPAPAEQRR